MSESFLAVAETGNFTKAAESGKLDLIFTIRDSVKNVKFERRSQSDCVHEQVAKADCECPFYWVKLAEMKNTSLQNILLDSCNEAVLAWRNENKNPAFSCFLQEIQKLL